jgi:hypothetical protein
LTEQQARKRKRDDLEALGTATRGHRTSRSLAISLPETVPSDSAQSDDRDKEAGPDTGDNHSVKADQDVGTGIRELRSGSHDGRCACFGLREGDVGWGRLH